MAASIPKVYKAINSIMLEMAQEGISKENKNTQQGYKFRGIDDVYNALASKLAHHGLCIIPRVIDKTVREKETRSGGALIYTTLTVEYDIICVEDGSKHTACIVGEAMDSGDKSCNKALSAAFKYLCLQTFCIPTIGDNDADLTTHDILTDYQKQMKDAISMLLKCNTHEELSLLKSTLPPEIITNPEFKTTGLKVYEAIKQLTTNQSVKQ